MNFAALESRINAVVLSKLGNATAAITGAAVAGTFDADWFDALGAGATRPTFVGGADALAAVEVDTAVTITCAPLALADASYVVADKRPEHGLTRLILRRQVA